MSDRTSVTAHITLNRPSTPEDIEKLSELDMDPDEVGSGADFNPTDPTFIFAQSYEHRMGETRYVLEEIQEMFPDAIEITVWEDPKYEYLGTLDRWSASDGDFSAACDANGNVVVIAPDIEKILSETACPPLEGPVEGYFALREALERAIGIRPLTTN